MDADSERLAEYLVALFEAKTGVDLRSDETAMKRVHEVAERETQKWRKYFFAVEVNLPFITATPDGPLHFEETIGGARAKRLFAGEDYAQELAAAREERDRQATEKRAKKNERKRERESEERGQRKADLKIGVVMGIILLAIVASVAALSASRHHEDQDRKERSTEHH